MGGRLRGGLGGLLLLASCHSGAAALSVQGASAARAGDLLVYKSLDAGWQRAIIRGSACADEHVIRINGGKPKSDPAIDCGDGGAP